MLQNVVKDNGFMLESGFVTPGAGTKDDTVGGIAGDGTGCGTTEVEPENGTTAGGTECDKTGAGMLTGGTLTVGTVCASMSTDDGFEVTVVTLKADTDFEAAEDIGNWVDNGVFPGCRIFHGVSPEGLIGCLFVCFF